MNFSSCFSSPRDFFFNFIVAHTNQFFNVIFPQKYNKTILTTKSVYKTHQKKTMPAIFI